MSRVVIVIGLALLALHAVLMVRAVRFRRSAVRVPGEIVGFQEVPDHSRRTASGKPKRAYYPEMRFRTPDGREHGFSSQSGSSGPAYRRGEIVEVLYPVGEPSAAEINSFSAIWAGPIRAGALGTLALIFGVGGWFQARRMRAPRVGTVVRLKG